VGLGRVADALPLLEQAVERAASMKLMANHPLVENADRLFATSPDTSRSSTGCPSNRKPRRVPTKNGVTAIGSWRSFRSICRA
jgi:hypothetical protein